MQQCTVLRITQPTGSVRNSLLRRKHSNAVRVIACHLHLGWRGLLHGCIFNLCMTAPALLVRILFFTAHLVHAATLMYVHGHSPS